jgi:hypothetical protein
MYPDVRLCRERKRAGGVRSVGRARGAARESLEGSASTMIKRSRMEMSEEEGIVYRGA